MPLDPRQYFPLEPRENVRPPGLLTSAPGSRRPALTRAVYAQLNVQGDPRYRPYQVRNAKGQLVWVTWCNTYVWDCCELMGAPGPHWVYANGDPAPPFSKTPGVDELDGNEKARWFRVHGPRHGWHPCSRKEAEAMAAVGRPVVGCWENPNGSGHVGMMLPNGRLAQAGLVCLFDVPWASGFPVEPAFYWHE